MENQDGVSLLIFLKDIDGLAQVGRDFLSKISMTNFNFDVVDTSLTNKCPKLELERISTNKAHFKKQLFFNTLEQKLDKKNYNIKVIFWEFESGMLEYRPNIFDGVNEVIAFTDFIYNYLLKVAPENVKVVKMKYPFISKIDFKPDKTETRKKYNINPDDFVCFLNFDYRSSYDRKNPEASVKAFEKAFENIENAKLIIKTSGFDVARKKALQFEQYVKNSKVSDKIIIVNEYLSREKFFCLMDACNCYISLHRGEGLGLGMLEAMSVAKPVIATNYSGNTEFMNENNSLLVDYILVDANDSLNEAYRRVEKWAEPNIEAAAKYLTKLYENPDFAIETGKKAKDFVEKYFSFEDFKSDLERVLGIKEQPQKAQCLLQKKKKIYFKQFVLGLITLIAGRFNKFMKIIGKKLKKY